MIPATRIRLYCFLLALLCLFGQAIPVDNEIDEKGMEALAHLQRW